MNRLNDEQMDRIIKEKFKQDNTISDKVNSIFVNFNPQIEDKTSIKEETNKTNANAKTNTNANIKVINAMFYKKLNKILSVAAVSLTMVLVGGTALYFNKDKIKNWNAGNETITYTKTYAIKNEPLYYSNEQVLKEIENHYVKVYLIGNSDVCVQFLSDYWDELNSKSIIISSDAYKIDGIEGKMKDIFVGRAVNSVIPYIFVLMDDGTAMYVDLNFSYGYETDLYYYAVPLEGLDNIVGFEEKTRNFSYSRTEYTYVNAIRSDGKRKEIEFSQPLNWDENSPSTFDIYNEKYVAVHNGGAIPDDGKGDFEVDNIHYWGVDRDNRYVYYMKGEFMSNDLYRVERSTGNETLIASGIGGMARNNPDGRISFYVNENNYKIYELDDNIVYRHRDDSIINEVTNVVDEPQENETNTPNINNLSEFEKKVYESGEYYYSKNGHYCIKNPRELNIAYYIEEGTLYRVIIPNDDSVESVATVVKDLNVDDENNLIVILQADGSLFGNYEGNVIFKEFTVTDFSIVQTSYDENFDVLLKEDGSLSILLHTGALKRLGFNSDETIISENVYYNVVGSGYGIKNTKNSWYYANAKGFCIAPAGRNGRDCLVYYRDDGNVIAIDILNAIECGNFTGAKTSIMQVEEKIESLYYGVYADDKDEKGNNIPEYNTILIRVKDKNGKELDQHMYMPCEDL